MLSDSSPLTMFELPLNVGECNQDLWSFFDFVFLPEECSWPYSQSPEDHRGD